MPLSDSDRLTTLRRVKSGSGKVILPICHKVSFEEVREFSPTLADKLASTSDAGADKLVEGTLPILE